MIRVLALVVVIAALASGAVWLAERPGTIVVTWQGHAYETSLLVALVALVVIAIALSMLFSLLRLILRAPSLIALARRTRRRARGYDVASRGLVAVGAGDPAGAKRFAGEARKLLGEEPLTLLLEAQSAQLAGDRAAAETAFRRMTDTPQTKLLGLRGLFIEAKRRGDADAARARAEEAVRLAPAAAWANEAILVDRCAAGDFAGARIALDRAERLRVLDKKTGARQRAVLLTAEAMALADSARRDEARDLAVEANRLAPDLVPAAVLAGRLLAARGEMRKAAKILETAWKAGPHPDIAFAHLNLRSGDSALDRMARAKALARLQPASPESAMIVARAAIDAREFGEARAAMAPLINGQPTRRACLLMAEIEAGEPGNDGLVRGWLARASKAPRDPAWVADGFVSDVWAPISPVTGRIDAYLWMVPPERLAAPAEPSHEVIADANEPEAPIVVSANPPASAMEPDKGPTAPMSNGAAPLTAKKEIAVAASAEPTAPAAPSATPVSRPLPVVFPVPRLPDDPGADSATKPTDEAPQKRARFRLLF